jgi:hypothetical protein
VDPLEDRLPVLRGDVQIALGRAALAVGAGAADETEAVMARGAIAKRSSRDLTEKELELSLGYDPMCGDDLEEADVERRQRSLVG